MRMHPILFACTALISFSALCNEAPRKTNPPVVINATNIGATTPYSAGYTVNHIDLPATPGRVIVRRAYAIQPGYGFAGNGMLANALACRPVNAQALSIFLSQRGLPSDGSTFSVIPPAIVLGGYRVDQASVALPFAGGSVTVRYQIAASPDQLRAIFPQVQAVYGMDGYAVPLAQGTLQVESAGFGAQITCSMPAY